MKDFRESRYFDLIRYLLMQGYIDRSYRDFMSVFREGGVSLTDREFLRDAGAGRRTDPAYAFEHPGNAVSKTPKLRFAQKAYRNRSLLNALLETSGHGNGEKLDVFMSALAADYDVEFVLDYVCSDDFEGGFLDKALVCWPSMPDNVIEGSEKVGKQGEGADAAQDEGNREKLRRFAWRILSYGRFEVGGPDAQGDFMDFVNGDPLILSHEATEHGDICKALGEAGARLSCVDEGASDRSLVEKVCDGNLYEPNAHMVGVMVKVVRGVDAAMADPSVILTTVESDHDGIYEYCDSRIGALLESVLDASPGGVKDAERAALWVLNREWPGSPENALAVAKRYARALPGKRISNLEDVEVRELWPSLLEGFAVEPTAGNVALYYNERSSGALSDELVAFINELGIPDMTGEAYQESLAGSGFAHDALVNEGVELERLELILHGAKAEITSLPAGVPEERVCVAAGCGSIAMSQASLSTIGSHYPSCIAGYIKSNPTGYVAVAKGRPSCMYEQEIKELLKDDGVDVDAKTELASLLSTLKPDPEYDEALNIHVIENQFDTSAVAELGELRADATANLGAAIDAKFVELAEDDHSLLSGSLPAESCLAVMGASSSRLSELSKVAILAENVAHYSRAEVARCAQALGFVNLYKVVALEVKSAKLEGNEADPRLIEALRKQGYCGKLTETGRLFARG